MNPRQVLVCGASLQFKVLAGSYLALFLWVLARVPRFPAAYVLTAAFAVLPILVWPSVITVSDVGITSRSVWGRRRVLRWTELRRVLVTQREIAFIADNGQTIRHGLLHARRTQLLHALSERVPEKILYRA